MEKTKVCKICKNTKDLKDFYICQGVSRTECKLCTVKKNAKYQKRSKAWLNRVVDKKHIKIYMQEYYQKNKQKYLEYRERFKEGHPDYFKLYARRRKNEKT